VTGEEKHSKEEKAHDFSCIINPYDDLPPLGIEVVSSWEKPYKDQLPFLVIGINPYRHSIKNFKFPPDFKFIDHQTSGVACHHPGLIGKILPITLETKEKMRKLHKMWYGSNCGSWGVTLSELKRYQADLKRILNVDCDKDYGNLEEAYYPIDTEFAQDLTIIDDLPDFESWLTWDGPDNSWFKNLGYYRRWSLMIYAENSD